MTELIITRAGLETHMARAELATEAALPRRQMRDAPERSGEVIQVPINKPD